MAAIGKKVRFEVFKRDKFTCQYCGQKAPEVVLHVDHINPKARGGKNDVLNLITSCLGCNLGKGARLLSDDSVVEKQRRQLEDLQERREQLEMMVDWQRTLVDLDAHAVAHAAQFWCDLMDWKGITKEGEGQLRKLIRKYSLGQVLDAMSRARAGYVKFDEKQEPTSESREHAFSKIGGILHMQEVEKEKPYLRDLFYIRGIVRSRFSNTNLHQAKEWLEAAYSWDATSGELKSVAFDATSWTNWKERMGALIDDLQIADEGR